MSLLVLSLPDSANVTSILSCANGSEFVALSAYLTNNGIQFVSQQKDAVSVGTYCTPINFSANQFLYFQSMDTGVGSVFHVTIGYFSFVKSSP